MTHPNTQPSESDTPFVLPRERWPDTQHLITEDGRLLDGIYTGIQMRLLVSTLYCSWRPAQPFFACCNVGVFFANRNPAIVPDVLVSLGAQPSSVHSTAAGQSYLMWDTGKPPDIVIEIVETADGGELTHLLPKANTPHFDGAWSPDSKRIIFVYDILQGTDGKLQLDVMNADGSGQKNLLPHKTFFEESPRYSFDGKKIAWTSTRNKNQDIWLMDADGANPKALTNDLAIDNAPTWSPDGKQLAFTSARAGNLDIWVMNADGSGQKRLTTDPKMDYWPAWSPDGKKIAFTSNRDGNYEIYLMNPDGTGQQNLTRHPGNDNYATWSPDSRRLAWISNRDGEYGIYVIDLAK